MDQRTAFRIFVEMGHYFSWLAFRDRNDPVIEKGQFFLDHLVTKNSVLFEGMDVEEIEEIRVSALEIDKKASNNPKSREKLLKEALLAVPTGYVSKASILALQIVFLNATPDNHEQVEEAALSLLRVLPMDEKSGKEALGTFKALYF